MYADYRYYSTIAGLNNLDQQEYDEYGKKASDYMDYISFGRVNKFRDNEQVKRCCCYLTEIIKKHSHGKIITSERSGNWSASYSSLSKSKEVYECVNIYLAPLGLLYRGIK